MNLMALYVVLAQHFSRLDRRHNPCLLDAGINNRLLDLLKRQALAGSGLNGSILHFIHLPAGSTSDNGRKEQTQRDRAQTRWFHRHPPVQQNGFVLPSLLLVRLEVSSQAPVSRPAS